MQLNGLAKVVLMGVIQVTMLPYNIFNDFFAFPLLELFFGISIALLREDQPFASEDRGEEGSQCGHAQQRAHPRVPHGHLRRQHEQITIRPSTLAPPQLVQSATTTDVNQG